jgi:probable HAF family extracellular repeat protein
LIRTITHTIVKLVSSTLSTFLAISLPIATIGQTYTITNLGSPSWSYSEAHGINNVGNVVGEYEPTNFFYVKALLNSNGVFTDLGNLAGTPYAIAYAINETNQIVGESNSHLDTHAFLYENGRMSDLGTLTPSGGSGYSSAHAINRSGLVAGESSLALASTIHAALFSGGTIKDLGALGGDYSAAFGINNSEVIVGESDVVQLGVTNVHAFIYANSTSGPMVDLGTLGGNYSSARGINDSGTVVGEAETVTSGATLLHAFRNLNGAMTDLGTLGGKTSSASAINSAGMIVGYATDTNEVANAFLHNGSRMLNLTALLPPNSGWTNLASADGINDAGQIIGSGYLADGEYQGYLLTFNGPSTIAITDPAFQSSSFSFSFATQAGHTYEAQFASLLSPTNSWMTFTNLSGNGLMVRVSDSTLTNTQRYYRVVGH